MGIIDKNPFQAGEGARSPVSTGFCPESCICVFWLLCRSELAADAAHCGGVIKDRRGDVAGGGGAGEVAEIIAPLVPESGVVGEGALQGIDNRRRGFGERAGFIATEEFVVPLFLTRHDLVHQHRTERIDGFLCGGAAGFADD